MALCGCGRPLGLAGERGWAGGAGVLRLRRGATGHWQTTAPRPGTPLLGGFRSELRRATTAGAAALSSHVSPGAAGTHVSGQTVLPAHLFPAWGWRA